MLTYLSIAMKNILYAAIASVGLISCTNEQAAMTTATVQTQRDGDDKSADRDQRGLALRADEKAIELIRRSLSADRSLPTNGKSVKLILSERFLTLRGLVTSEQEKVSIGSVARQYVGARHIDNQLEVVNRDFE
jgi:osmotically-inducible protein OsmY